MSELLLFSYNHLILRYSSVKVGTVSQTPGQVLANLKTALPSVVKNVKGLWDNIQSLHIKTNSSASLPIWTCDLGSDEGGRWAGLVASVSDGEESDDDDGSFDEDDLEIDEEELKALQAEISGMQMAKGKKRVAEEEVEKPKKKAKAGADTSDAPGKAKPSTNMADPAAPAAVSGISKKASSMTVSQDASSAPKQPKKRKDGDPRENQQQPTKVTSAPATPKSTKKKARASAVDFFEDEQLAGKTTAPASPAPPPNTPATALAGQTPVPGSSKRKVKTAGTPQTPVSSAIRKLSVEAEAAESGPTTKKKVVKEGKNEVTETPEGAAATGKKVKAKKARGASIDAASASPALEAASISALTTDDLKEKKRNAVGLEKRKEKLSKDKSAAKSAKEGVLGKKRV